MTQQYNNELQGALFKNDKGGVETRADYTGPATIGGQKYQMKAWINKSRKGETYIGVKFAVNDGVSNAGSDDSESKPVDDSIPF